MDEQSKREEQAELEAEAKAIFLSLKEWYEADSKAANTLSVAYGEFPMFSRELAVWPHFRKVLKAYKAAKSEDTNSVEKKPEKKRRSRWGTVDESDAGTKDESENNDGEKKKKKRSRWGEESTALTSTQGSIHLHQQKTFLLRLQIDEINRKLLTVVYDAKIAENDPNRSPSPEPIYDNKGKRVNTREVRMRERLESDKQMLLEELVTLNPSLKPANMRMSSLTRKIYIPAKDYPGYNFIGLIIGPRGNTQKRMEKETNCKISIRGKGSVKPGRRARDGKPQEDSNEELHVLVQGQDEDGVNRAVEMVEALLKPVDDASNDHKQKQLRELAMINGTLREENYCSNCGQPGHKQWECPNEAPRTFTMADVQCAICGDKSHPTADCPRKNIDQDTVAKQHAIDADYFEFMEMVGGEKAGPVGQQEPQGLNATAAPNVQSKPEQSNLLGAQNKIPQTAQSIPQYPAAFPGSYPQYPAAMPYYMPSYGYGYGQQTTMPPPMPWMPQFSATPQTVPNGYTPQPPQPPQPPQAPLPPMPPAPPQFPPAPPS